MLEIEFSWQACHNAHVIVAFFFQAKELWHRSQCSAPTGYEYKSETNN
jgi:hypothetical protein